MFEPMTVSGDRTRLAIRVSRALVLLIPILASMTLPADASAQVGGRDFLFEPPRVTLSVRAGWGHARAGSDLFDDLIAQHTRRGSLGTASIERSEFSGLAFAADLGLFVSDQFDIVLGSSISWSGVPSELREYVDQDDLPIEQKTTLTRVPVTASARFYPIARGRSIGSFAWVPSRWAPYVGAGVGLMYYDFRQEGDFVDFLTEEIYSAKHTSSGWARTAHVFGGFEVNTSRRSALTAEVRYLWGSQDLGVDYLGFEPIDLAGLQTTVGFSFRL